MLITASIVLSFVFHCLYLPIIICEIKWIKKIINTMVSESLFENLHAFLKV